MRDCKAKPIKNQLRVPHTQYHTDFKWECGSWRIAVNGFRLGEVAEIEAQMFSFAQNFN